MNRRRVAAAAFALLCFTASGSILSAHASDEPGSAFYGYTVLGQASGLEMVEDRPTANSHPEADAEVPLARTSLVSGPVGYALGSVAWPSALVANAGDLLVFAGNGNVPEQLGPPLDEPVRAETRTGGAQDVTNTDYPGTSMHASVKPAQVAADGVVDGGQAGSATGFGRTETHSTATLDAASVASTARASVKDVAIAGAVTVKSVVSSAQATSNGVTASASGTTLVSGMSVGGVPVTVDGSGVHVAGNGTPVDTETVNSTLASLGMRIVLSGPTVTKSGATVSYDSGSLVIYFNPSADESMTVRLGGARVTAGASAADPSLLGPAGPPAQVPPAVGSSTGSVPQAAVVPASAGGTANPPVTQPQTPVVLAPVAASGSKLLLGGETAPRSALALAALGALALLVALLRFPSAVVDLPAGPACPPRSTA